MTENSKDDLRKQILQIVDQMRARQQYERAYYWEGLTGNPLLQFSHLGKFSCLFHKGGELSHLKGMIEPLIQDQQAIYVSTSKTFQHIKETLGENIFRKLFILDCASNNLFNPPKEPSNCMYFDKPATLRDLMAIIDELAQTQGSHFVIIDALSDYMLFNNVNSDSHRESIKVLQQSRDLLTERFRKMLFLFDGTRGKKIHVPSSYFDKIYEVEVIKELMKDSE